MVTNHWQDDPICKTKVKTETRNNRDSRTTSSSSTSTVSTGNMYFHFSHTLEWTKTGDSYVRSKFCNENFLQAVDGWANLQCGTMTFTPLLPLKSQHNRSNALSTGSLVVVNERMSLDHCLFPSALGDRKGIWSLKNLRHFTHEVQLYTTMRTKLWRLVTN